MEDFDSYLAKENEKFYNYFINDVPINKWEWTEKTYQSLLKEFSERRVKVPNEKLYIQKEIDNYKDIRFKEGVNDSGYNFGFEVFEDGKELEREHLEWQILERDFDIENPNDKLCMYLVKVSEGYANAKFYYELLSIKENLMVENKKESKNIKLKWKGSKIQLYSVLRQLKNQYELIGNSYNELAEFLINNVTGFNETKKETVEKELKKENLPPKERRVNINPNTQE
jgi:hypothetical protein